MFAFLAVLYKQSFAELGYLWTGIIASKGLSGNVFALLLNAAGKDDLQTFSFFDTPNDLCDYAINYGIYLVILVVIYVSLRKQDKLSEDFQSKRSNTRLYHLYSGLPAVFGYAQLPCAELSAGGTLQGTVRYNLSLYTRRACGRVLPRENFAGT